MSICSGESQTKTTQPARRISWCSFNCSGPGFFPGAFNSIQAWQAGKGKKINQSGAPDHAAQVHFRQQPPKSLTRLLRYAALIPSGVITKKAGDIPRPLLVGDKTN